MKRHKCPVCAVITESLWRENGTQELPVCEQCNRLRMELHEDLRDRQRDPDELRTGDPLHAWRLENVFFAENK